MLTSLRSYFAEIMGSVVASGGAVTALASWQAQLAWGVTVIAALVGITSGALTIRSILRRDAEVARAKATDAAR